MSIEIETSGDSVEEAINIALEELGVEREDIEVEILEESSKGFLGLRGHGARIRVRVKPEVLTGATPQEPAYAQSVTQTDITDADREVLDSAQAFLDGLLAKMDIAGQVSATMREGAPHLDIDGDDMGLLIGRGGDTLSALQTIVSAHLSRLYSHKLYAVVDIQGYRERKRESLEGLAERIADRVSTTRKAYTMRPMPAAERRIIHIWVKENHARVDSTSEGLDPNRCVIIFPKEN